MILAPSDLSGLDVTVLCRDAGLKAKVENVLAFVADCEVGEGSGLPVAVDHASMMAEPEAMRMPVPIGQAWGWLDGTADMRRVGLEEWTVDARSYIQQHKLEGTHPSLGGMLKHIVDIGRQNRRNVDAAMMVLSDDLSRTTLAAIVDCDFLTLIDLYKKRAFAVTQYFEGVDVAKTDRVLNVGIHTGWDLPYWLLQSDHVVSVDPVAPNFLAEYVKPFVAAANPDLNICALDSYTGKCVLPVSDDGQAMGGYNGREFLRRTEEFDCASLDDFAATFGPFDIVKMDTEGAERNILWGGMRWLRHARPRMAISVYHRADDFWEIPLWIARHLGGYRMYMRPYSFSGVETVLYCIPEERAVPERLPAQA